MPCVVVVEGQRCERGLNWPGAPRGPDACLTRPDQTSTGVWPQGKTGPEQPTGASWRGRGGGRGRRVVLAAASLQRRGAPQGRESCGRRGRGGCRRGEQDGMVWHGLADGDDGDVR